PVNTIELGQLPRWSAESTVTFCSCAEEGADEDSALWESPCPAHEQHANAKAAATTARTLPTVRFV
ncbi:MAG TPA: hypothetical protein VHX17_00470, partial [Candidatus Cybelea sp.]|nr:hypothetical protein [Candidatus Cybelea sp.]